MSPRSTSPRSTSLKRWFAALTPTQRTLVAVVATVDLGLRTWALADVVRRPADEVRGRKLAWAVGLATVSSGGLLPAIYLTRGRRTGR